MMTRIPVMMTGILGHDACLNEDFEDGRMIGSLEKGGIVRRRSLLIGFACKQILAIL